ncbi:MAG TPA: cytochrome c oxidase assembly protein [Candidatus Binataceae bacterium]|nr:cytochrome c oxidase assembly protein [Candidatus Binataceae bacterium]
MARIALAWDPDFSVLLGCAALLVGYYLTHRAELSRAPWFVAGVAAMLLALVSPLDPLGDEYLFSAHMLQHLALELAVPPLLLLGISPRFARAVVDYAPLGRVERALGNPLVAWPLGVGMLALWHLPALFDAALGDEYVHIFEHLCFLVSATIFWWPILSPLPECRVAPLWAQLYLLGGAMANSLLGIWLTFAPAGLYAPYLHPADTLDVERLLRAGLGLTPALDQQIGGLLMWVGGGFVFLAVMVAEFLPWFAATAGESAPDARGLGAKLG